MKNSFLISILLLLNGCCAFTSEDCNCTPPSPELSQEAMDWITPYNEVEFLVYADDNGILDTLQIERVQDKEWVGGEECGTYGDVEKAILTSNNNHKLITVSATRIDNVGINDLDDDESYITGYLKINEDELIVFNEQSSGTVIDNYDWNGIETTVIEITCENSSECNNLKMKSFTISREIGLLKFTDSTDHNWTLVN
jgi:hypothetical protein